MIKDLTSLVIEALAAVERGEDDVGFCVECGAEASGVEPDARRYKCEDCGLRGVYGAETLVLLGT